MDKLIRSLAIELRARVYGPVKTKKTEMDTRTYFSGLPGTEIFNKFFSSPSNKISAEEREY